jgi:hypothetical protein
VWEVYDQQDAAKPAEIPYSSADTNFYYQFVRPVTYAMQVPAKTRARNINSVGGVPDSTWFVNRIGRRKLTPEDVARGPGVRSHPAPGSLVVVGGKLGGTTPGFLVEDRQGERYIVKVDIKGFPEVETGAEIVCQRLFWALGYHVPQIELIELERGRLIPGEGATWTDIKGRRHPMSDTFIDEQLDAGDRRPDGKYRASVSRLLPGKPLGGYPPEGVREDDHNDTVPHEHRRELRAQQVFFGWIAHTDVKTGNTLDLWMEHPTEPDRHFVMHYVLDFGKALGAFATIHGDIDETWSHSFDYGYVFGSLFTFGLWVRPWENYPTDSPIPGIGRIDAAHFNPGKFKTRSAYPPLWHMDVYDALWATRLLLALSPQHIKAAVQQGQYSDPRAVDYLTDTLVYRRRKAARYWLSKVAPIGEILLERATPGAATVCAENLWLAHRLGERWFEHHVTVMDGRGRTLAPRRKIVANRVGWICASIPIARARHGYTVAEFQVRSNGKAMPLVSLHVARGPDGLPRIIGVHRQ